VNFAAITLCVASQRVFIFVDFYFVMTQSGNFWIHRRTFLALDRAMKYFFSYFIKCTPHRKKFPIKVLNHNTLFIYGSSGSCYGNNSYVIIVYQLHII